MLNKMFFGVLERIREAAIWTSMTLLLRNLNATAGFTAFDRGMACRLFSTGEIVFANDFRNRAV